MAQLSLVVSACRQFAVIGTMLAVLLVQPLQLAAASADSRASSRPYAVVTLTNAAHVSNMNAVGGTTVYPGDTLDTGDGGELRLVIGPGQAYLLSDSAVRMLQDGSVLQASLIRGTVGFASLTDQEFQIVTPEGIVEAANGLPAFGQVTFSGPKDIVISAYTGALVLHRGTQTLIVKAGQSYYVSLVPDDALPQKGSAPYAYHLEWRLIIIGTAAGVGYWLWRVFSASPSSP